MHELSSVLAQPWFSQLSCAKVDLSDNGAVCHNLEDYTGDSEGTFGLREFN